MLMVTKKSSTRVKKSVQTKKDAIVVRKSALINTLSIVMVGLALLLAVYLVIHALKVNTETTRLNKIQSIYTSLKLDSHYRMTRSDVFGDKRVYQWDAGRTFSSSIEYGHRGKPADVRAELRKKVEAAGFKYVQTEYENSMQPIDEYKNANGNYVRVGVMSGFMQNAIMYGTASQDIPLIAHKDEAPSYVTIKVNLDDNNE